MSLRIRRGTDAQRQPVVFDQGELIYTTDTYKLFIGDGTTAGGKSVLANMVDGAHGLVFDQLTQTIQATNTGGIAAVSDDPAPSLGGNLNLNTRSINGTGTIAITGSITGTTVRTNTISATNNAVSINMYLASGNDLATNFYNGNISAPVSTNPGDSVGSITIKGYNGSSYVIGSAIFSQWDSNAVLSSQHPASSLNFVVGNNTDAVIASLKSTGVFQANGFQTGVFTSTPETRPTGAKGMIIFNDTTGKFQGYNGSAWVDLN